MLDISKINALIAKMTAQKVAATESTEKYDNLDELQRRAHEYFGPDSVTTSADVAKSLGAVKAEEKFMSGWSELDAITGGFRPSQLVIVSAPTKNGKTAWCMEMSSQMEETSPLWFLFEETPEEMITKYNERGLTVPNFYMPRTNRFNDINWIEERIIESIAKHKTKTVFIDHLDFIVPFNSESQRHDLVQAETVRSLKQMANRWKITIFLVCHIKKVERMDKMPDISEIRGTASIVQEADTAIMLWRVTKKDNRTGTLDVTNEVKVSVQANRRTGKTGTVSFMYQGYKYLPMTNAFDEEAEKQYNIL